MKSFQEVNPPKSALSFVPLGQMLRTIKKNLNIRKSATLMHLSFHTSITLLEHVHHDCITLIRPGLVDTILANFNWLDAKLQYQASSFTYMYTPLLQQI